MLPSRWLSKLAVQSARIYINVENAYLFSKYKLGYDPENTTYNATSYSGAAAGQNIPTNAGSYNSTTADPTKPAGAFAGVDYGSYPVPRVITFGVKLDF